MLLIRYYFYVCQNKLFSNDKSGLIIIANGFSLTNYAISRIL